MENENNFKETVSSLFKGMDGFVSAKTVVGLSLIHISLPSAVPGEEFQGKRVWKRRILPVKPERYLYH